MGPSDVEEVDNEITERLRMPKTGEEEHSKREAEQHRRIYSGAVQFAKDWGEQPS